MFKGSAVWHTADRVYILWAYIANSQLERNHANYLGGYTYLTLLHSRIYTNASEWRHNECNAVPSHRPLGCLLNHLFRCGSKKPSSAASLTGHQWIPLTVTRKMFPFDDVIMGCSYFPKYVLIQEHQNDSCTIKMLSQFPARSVETIINGSVH